MMPGPDTQNRRDFPMTNLINRFKNDESGVTAIEYGLIAGLLSLVIIVGLGVASPKLDAIFDKIGEALPAV